MASTSFAVGTVEAGVERTHPQSTVRGTVLVLPGRGDDSSYYRRLSARLAADGYAAAVATAPLVSTDDVVRAARIEAEGVFVIVGVDTSAGLLASALAAGSIERVPDGAVFAGIAVDVSHAAHSSDYYAGDEISARSACPVHRGVVEAAGVAPLSESTVAPVWPEQAARIPVLAVHGGADALSPVEGALPLLAGWDAEVVTVTGGLHDVLNDVHHRSVAAEIVQFLERLRSGATVPVLQRERIR